MRVGAFDDLTKELAGATSRRTLLKRALIGGGAVLVPLGAASEASAEKCKPLGHKCLTDVDCCSRFCDKEHGNVCNCTPTEIACAQPQGQANCVPRCASGLGPCKIDACNPTTGGCIVANAPNGTPCEDGDLCTLNDTCQNGTCQAGQLETCSDVTVTQCQEAFCNPQTGICEIRSKPNGSACDDNNPCTENDSCQNGVCAGTPITGCVTCTTASDCTALSLDQCQQAACTNGVCTPEPKANGTACNDNNPCTVNDTCQAGVCTPGSPRSCPSGTVCCPVGTEKPGDCKRAAGSTCNNNGQCCNRCVGGLCT